MSTRVRSLVLTVAVSLAVLAAGGVAHAQTQVDSVAPPLAPASSLTVPPPGFKTNANRAIAVGNRTELIRKLRRTHRDLHANPYIWGGWRWELDYVGGGVLLAEVDVSADGRVLMTFSGPQAQSYLARGHQGKLFDSPWVVLPFALLFLVPFVDLKRRRRLLHLDLAVLLSLGVSYWFFNRGDILTSVPLVYPVLLYVLGRMLWIGFRPRESGQRLVPHLSIPVLAVGLVILFGARVGLNLANEKIIDVGYASVVGADRVWHKKPLYTDNDVHGDTYGPINYLAYVPFERVAPWHGLWGDLPAAHAATIAFDLLTIVGLIALGMMLRAGPPGRKLGLALAWGWAAFPFTLLGMMLNTNDGLVAVFLVGALLGLASPPARGAMLALAAGAKFIPAALFPLFARGNGEERGWKPAAYFAAIFALVVALPVVLYLPDGGLREFYNATLGFQLGRSSVFSWWGLHGWTWLQDALKVAAFLLAVLVGFFPRGRRSVMQVAALGAAVLIAVQLPAIHWFYFYVAWFMPFVLVGLFLAYRTDSPAPEAAPAEDEPAERVAVAA